MKIRKRLLLTYVLAIVIPVAVTIGLFILVDIFINNNDDLNSVDTYGTVNKIVKEIYDHYDSIDNYDMFYEQVMSDLKGDNNKIIVIDLDGNLLFDSSDKDASITHEPYTIANQSYYDIHYLDEKEEIVRVIVPLIIDEEVIAKVEITQDRIQIDQAMIMQVLFSIIIVLAIGAIVLVTLIILFTKSVSNSVIKPLQYLSHSAKQIANGDLDQEIVYQTKDEFGEFVETFNTMRIKLKESLEKQHEMEKARKALIASVSHDLRTPITSIKGYVEAIQDGKAKSEEKLNQYLHVIHDKTNKLDRLIDDLFQFSQFELGNIKLNKEVIDSKHLLDNVYQQHYLFFNDANIDFKLFDIKSVDLSIDIYMIERVFDNILENAKRYIKHKHGEIIIQTKTHKTYLEIMISDNGEGIKSEDLPYIFNRFYRGEKSRSREFGGAGLGLSICKEIMEAHEGKIWVESVYGKGSTFYLQIPLKK